MSELRVLGCDPSLNSFGFAETVINLETMALSVNKVYVIQPTKADASTKKSVRKNSDDLRRARWLHDNLLKSLAGFDLVTVEMPVGSQSSRAMASYGIVIGVLSTCQLPMIEVTATEVKLAGAGNKTASKKEMIDWAVGAHPESNWKKRVSKGIEVLTADNEHAADALASVYAGMKTDQFKLMVAMSRRLAA